MFPVEDSVPRNRQKGKAHIIQLIQPQIVWLRSTELADDAQSEDRYHIQHILVEGERDHV